MANTVLFLVAAFCVLGFAMSTSAAEPPAVRIVAHRGLMHHAPENTLANFRACLELRLGFEFDVQKSKDGRLICIHDDTLERTTNGTGTVAETLFNDLRKLDAGRWFDAKFAGETVPTVEEVLKLVAEYQKHDVLIAVDLKSDGVEEEVVRLAEKQKILPKLLFIGTTISEPSVRERIKKTSRHTQTSIVANSPDEFSKALAATDEDWIYFRYIPSTEEMTAVRTAGKRTFIAGKTVAGNLPDNWRRAAKVGIDCILTDYPLELRAVLKKRD